MKALDTLALALGEAGNPFAALDAALQQLVGHRFLTVLLYRHDLGVAERLYSNRPEMFPTGGRKRFEDAPTQKRVAETRRPYIGPDAASLRRDFPDHEKIFALGCSSILNMPVLWAGQALGQVNLLHEEGHFGTQHLPPVRVAVQMCVPAFLALKETTP
ncbi:GAF domain-containing protein [Rhodovarius crocodyli]|uniref:GAF domain-containing protein n=1 Tax=Rhodovarius crocodyli TaxID=1979269 RepID=A0A437MLM9_9PROT|nr:GAF domain-containing protein [Rhodovarius crocodyli]RVT98568.1 GAF domain-containing protein [Rhodovarius crocodyli]